MSDREARFRRSLLDWYDANRRDLPWRRTRDPYAIWVSEAMLQQTTVATVTPRWEAFLARFPTVRALAEADESDVLHEWRGLGYYRRARNLHAAARRIAAEHGGIVPLRHSELRLLPGIGEYTAAAIASIAGGEVVPVFDANVRRVAARLLACAEPADTARGAALLRAEVARLIDTGRPGDFNQAIMELGATVCTPRKPSCAACPVAAHCAANARSEQPRYPVLSPRPEGEEVRQVSVVLRAGDAWLWLRRGDGGSFAGMWETPRGEMRPGESIARAARRVLQETTGIGAEPAATRVIITHTVMNTRIRLHAAEALLPRRTMPRLPAHAEHTWATPAEAALLPMSSSQHRLLARFSGPR